MTDYGSSSTGSSGHSFGMRAVTAMFDSRSDAEEAVEELISAGFSRSDVRMVPGHERDDTTSASTLASGSSVSGTSSHSASSSDDNRRMGFWESLSDFFFPEEDRHSYAEGLSRGSYLVTVNTTEANHDMAVDILDDEGTIDLDEREDQWRSEGWGGYGGSSTGDSTRGASGMTGAGMTGAGTSGAGVTGTGMSGTGMSGSSTGATSGGYGDTSGSASRTSVPEAGGAGMGSDWSGAASDDESLALGGDSIRRTAKQDAGWASSRGSDKEGEQVLPLAEEELRIGKRQVEGGRVRVRSYVVERPVEEQVMLRREHVDVQRRNVDRAIGAGEDAFRERTVELEERSEQPVVSKDTRIREEVVVRKDVDNEQRTVSDTVRRTEVEVDDQRKSTDETKRRRT